jgi:hypothetical protein
MLINGAGCIATGVATLVIMAAKFVEGAWIILIIAPCLLLLFTRIHKHYDTVGKEVQYRKPFSLSKDKPLVVITLSRWTAVAAEALEFACSISDDVYALHISTGEEETNQLKEDWNTFVQQPLKAAGKDPPEFTSIVSPYRELEQPLLDYVGKLKKKHKKRTLAVLIPELVQQKWYTAVLHKQYGAELRRTLMSLGDDGVVIVNVPFRLDKDHHRR